MQKKRLIPTPLISTSKLHKRIEFAEPDSTSKSRIFRILWFVLGSVLRSIAARLWPAWRKTRLGPVPQARRLRLFMEQMGGMWVKAGQIVAMRRDLFPEEFCAEIAKLQDCARGFPGRHARRVIEEDLGQPLEEVFAEFDEQPLAAASIGQVHRARLREPDVEVVVKVRRPQIVESFSSDLRTINRFVRFLNALNVSPHSRFSEMFTELERTIQEELDYQQEAASLARMRKNLQRQNVYVPKVYRQWCTDHVLVMERVHGVYMSEYIHAAAVDPDRVAAWCKENQINPRRVGKKLLLSHFQQRLEDNLYHCDLHPGNILLMRQSRITLIDFGSVGSSDKSVLFKSFQLMSAYAERDYAKAADVILMLAPSLPDRDLSELKEQISRIYRDFEPRTKIKSFPYHQKSSAYVVGQVVELINREGIPPAWDSLRWMRAELTLDASLMSLLPDIDYQKIMQKYVRQMQARQQAKLRSAKLVRTQLATLADSLNLPAKMAENAYFEGEHLRRRALSYEGHLSKAAKFGSSIFWTLSRACALGAVIALLLFAYQRYGNSHSALGQFLEGPLQMLSRLHPVVWVNAVFAGLYLGREFAAMRRILIQPAPARSDRALS